MSSRWLSVDEIAEHLGVSRDTVYRWIDHGLPAHKVQRLWKFKIEEVDAWVCAGKVASGSSSKSPENKRMQGDPLGESKR